MEANMVYTSLLLYDKLTFPISISHKQIVKSKDPEAILVQSAKMETDST